MMIITTNKKNTNKNNDDETPATIITGTDALRLRSRARVHLVFQWGGTPPLVYSYQISSDLISVVRIACSWPLTIPSLTADEAA